MKWVQAGKKLLNFIGLNTVACECATYSFNFAYSILSVFFDLNCNLEEKRGKQSVVGSSFFLFFSFLSWFAKKVRHSIDSVQWYWFVNQSSDIVPKYNSVDLILSIQITLQCVYLSKERRIINNLAQWQHIIEIQTEFHRIELIAWFSFQSGAQSALTQAQVYARAFHSSCAHQTHTFPSTIYKSIFRNIFSTVTSKSCSSMKSVRVCYVHSMQRFLYLFFSFCVAHSGSRRS